MKQLSVIVIAITIALCTFVTFCNREDTKNANAWRCTIVPRLSTDGPRRLACVDAPAPPAECEGELETREETIQAFATRPACMDTAIRQMETLASAGVPVQDDLAAAYYVRSQRDKQPLDLLRALDTAQQMKPPSPASLFNRALLQQELGLYAEAVASWDELLATDRTEWAKEAQHRRGLAQIELQRDGAAEWNLNVSRLAAPLRANDVDAVRSLIDAFPGSAAAYFEDEVLGRWAAEPTQEHLEDARTLANALSARLGGDPYNIDVVAAIDAALRNPERLRALREGYGKFRAARQAQKSFQFDDATEVYAEAATLLERGGSPLALQAHLGHAVTTPDYETGLALLPAVEHNYKHLAARTTASRAHLLANESRHVESLVESDRAAALYQQVRDQEGASNLESRRIGYLRVVGQQECSWKTATEQVPNANGAVELRNRHLLLGEAAKTALELGYSSIALGYMKNAVTVIRRRHASADPVTLPSVKHNLQGALRNLAQIELQMGNHAAARRNLDESIALLPEAPDENLRHALETRVQEVEGQALLASRPDQAIVAFTRALDAAGDELHSYRAAVRVQRAEAHIRLRQDEDAKDDLIDAVAELRAEEIKALEPRKPGDSEALWSRYFLRSQETHQRLIRHYAERGRSKDAFHRAESSRAFEPLNLILKGEHVPAEFRALTAGGNSISLENIQKHLPPGTFLIQYAVLDDRTYVWIVSRDAFEQLIEPATRDEVDRWSDAIQRAARQRNEALLSTSLDEPHKLLFERSITAAKRLNGGLTPTRLVFVPDGAMHGLPIAALKDEKTNRHIIEDAPVEIAGSATLYVYSLLRARELAGGEAPSALLIGDPLVSEQAARAHGVEQLPGAAHEVMDIHEIYKPRSSVRLGPTATVPALLDLAPRHSILHIAAHAIANRAEPSLSAVLLAESPGETGALDAAQLLKRLKLKQTKLVVLAACSSAGGVPVGPEGLAPLVRPFLAAGVPAVIGTLWDVNDATVDPLLVSFHRHYEQSGDAAAALRAAQVELLKPISRKSALTWAAFQVIGH